jgi:hypothetical protein
VKDVDKEVVLSLRLPARLYIGLVDDFRPTRDRKKWGSLDKGLLFWARWWDFRRQVVESAWEIEVGGMMRLFPPWVSGLRLGM